MSKVYSSIASAAATGSSLFDMQKLKELEKLLKQGQGSLDKAQKNKADKNKDIARLLKRQQQSNKNEKNADFRIQQLPSELATTTARAERESADALAKRLQRDKEDAEKALRSRVEQLKKDAIKTERQLRQKLTDISRNKLKSAESLRSLQGLKSELERYITTQSDEVAKKVANYAQQKRIEESFKRLSKR